MKRILIGCIALCAAIPLSGCAPAKTYKLSGTLNVGASVPSNVFYRVARKELAGECSGGEASDGFSDIDRGTKITIKDSTGKIVATSPLGAGTVTNLGMNGSCLFTFEVDRIPASDFYTIEIGSRKPMNYSAKELQEQDWNLTLVLGM